MLGMRLVTVDTWPFIGLSVKSGGIERGAVLKEEESIQRVKELLKLMIGKLESTRAVSLTARLLF